MTHRILLALSVILAATVLISFGASAVDLPTPPHNAAPFIIHQNLIPDPGPPEGLLCATGPPACINRQFGDNLNRANAPWHIEIEVVGHADCAPCSGLAVIEVPGGGWSFAYGPLAAGAAVRFEVLWQETPETGVWNTSWENFTATTLGVDSAITEDNDNNASTPFGFTGPPPPCDVLYKLDEIEQVPGLSLWGLTVLLLTMATGGLIVVRRQMSLA